MSKLRQVDVLASKGKSVADSVRSIGVLKGLGFSPIGARPRHPAQDQRTIDSLKKLPATLNAHLAHLPPS